MGSLTDMRASSPPDGEAAAAATDATSTSTVRSRGRGRSGAPRKRRPRRPRRARAGWRPRWRRRRRRAGRGAGDDGVRGGAGAGVGTPPRKRRRRDARDRLGVHVSVSLLGDPREGETLTLGVDAVALPPDCGPVTLRWQRGATCAGPAGGSNPMDAARGSAGAARVQDHRRRAARFVRPQGGRRVRSARGGRRGGRERGGERVRVRGDARRGRGEGVVGDARAAASLGHGHVQKRREKTLWSAKPEEKFGVRGTRADGHARHTKKATDAFPGRRSQPARHKKAGGGVPFFRLISRHERQHFLLVLSRLHT